MFVLEDIEMFVFRVRNVFPSALGMLVHRVKNVCPQGKEFLFSGLKMVVHCVRNVYPQG